MKANKKTRIPSLRHNNNRGFVELNGQRIYLGAWGDPETQDAYERTISEWLSNRKLPHVDKHVITITELCRDYWLHCEEYFVKPDGTATSSLLRTPTGVQIAPGGGGWSALSARAAKENFEAINPVEVLEKVVAMPIEKWNYKAQKDSLRHIGPMAEDFRAAFNIGDFANRITSTDADGVALAAIQGLNEILKEKQSEIDRLRAEKDSQIERLETENAKQDERFASLEQRLVAMEASMK